MKEPMQENIVGLLKNQADFVSGEEFSRILNISRAGIWKYIQELRKLGYVIEASPHKGYRLARVPDRLLPWEIRSGLESEVIGREVFCYDVLTSTMDEMMALALQGAREGTVVCAESQTNGRGRMGRAWVSPEQGGLYFSILLRPEVSAQEAAKMTLMSAVAISQAVRKVTGVDIRIKWPNDLLIHGRKVAGILTELNAEIDRVKFLVIGVGLNVNIDQPHLPPEATSLRIETRRDFSRVDLLREILFSFDCLYLQIIKEGFLKVFEEWKSLSQTMGEKVCCSDYGKSIMGQAVDLAEDGGLLIKTSSGKVIKRMSGDISKVD